MVISEGLLQINKAKKKKKNIKTISTSQAMESFNSDQTKTIIKQLNHVTLSWYSSNYTLVLLKLLLVKLIKCERPKHHKLALMQQVRSLIYSITN